MCYAQLELVIQDIGPMTTEGRRAVLLKRTDHSVKNEVLFQSTETAVTGHDLKTQTLLDCRRLKEGKTDLNLSDWKPGDVIIVFNVKPL